MPGLWCKRCKKKIDRPPKPKAKRQRPAQPVTEERTGISREFLDKLANTLLPPKKECKPYVIPPSSTDPLKPRTRTEFNEEFSWFEFYVRDRLVGIGKTEKEAMEDSVRRKGIPYSLVPSFKDDLDKRAATPAITSTTDIAHHQGTSASGRFFLPPLVATRKEPQREAHKEI
jgi:hypothetical protein